MSFHNPTALDIEMLLKDLGPFPGMTYLGRQKFDAVVSESFARTHAALTRLVDRQKDVMTDADLVYCGEGAFSSDWKGRKFTDDLLWGVLNVAFLGGLVLAVVSLVYGLRFSDHEGMAAGIVGSAIFLPFSAALSLISIDYLRHGYDSTDGFRKRSANIWVIGEKALYVSSGEFRGKKSVVKTVFYDAIGTVDTEETADGGDIVRLLSRDGKEIASIDAPTMLSTESAQAIADAITARIPA